MIEAFLKGHPTLWVSNQQPADKVLNIVREMPRKLQFHIDYFLVRILSALLRFKRRVPRTQLITQNSNTPHINHLIIIFASNNLRRNIIQGATEGNALSE
jgi:hypothetical protein